MPIIIGAGLLTAVWVVALAANLFDTDLLHHGETADAMTSRVYLIVATLATIAGIPVIVMGIRRQLKLASAGVQTVARPIRLGPAMNGRRAVTFAYMVNGVKHTVKRDVPEIFSRQYNAATRACL